LLAGWWLPPGQRPMNKETERGRGERKDGGEERHKNKRKRRTQTTKKPTPPPPTARNYRASIGKDSG